MKTKISVGLNIVLFGIILTIVIHNALSTHYYAEFRETPLNNTETKEKVWPEVDRGKYVLDVYNGSTQSALFLARHYGSIGLTEAQLFWLKKARDMGSKNVSQELIDACEASIFDERR